VEVSFHDVREFEKWLRSIDSPHSGRIVDKLRFVHRGGPTIGLPLVRTFGGGLSELRVDKYRVYFVRDGSQIHVVAAGSKDTQRRDISRARRRQP
jgi:putative addiction module killer protein